MADVALQRKNMVESQVRPSDVTDRRITAAMMDIPREKFVPPDLASFAYSDETLTVGAGRAMLAPRVLAKIMQLAEAERTDSALVVGGCCGYAAAVLGRLAGNVVALLPDQESAAAASQALNALDIRNVTAVAGKLAAGWPAKAPYGVILVEGGTEAIPEQLQAQLAPGGRLVTIALDRGIGRSVVLYKEATLVARREAFQVSAPLLPGFEAVRSAFVF